MADSATLRELQELRRRADELAARLGMQDQDGEPEEPQGPSQALQDALATQARMNEIAEKAKAGRDQAAKARASQPGPDSVLPTFIRVHHGADGRRTQTAFDFAERTLGTRTENLDHASYG